MEVITYNLQTRWVNACIQTAHAFTHAAVLLTQLHVVQLTTVSWSCSSSRVSHQNRCRPPLRCWKFRYYTCCWRPIRSVARTTTFFSCAGCWWNSWSDWPQSCDIAADQDPCCTLQNIYLPPWACDRRGHHHQDRPEIQQQERNIKCISERTGCSCSSVATEGGWAASADCCSRWHYTPFWCPIRSAPTWWSTLTCFLVIHVIDALAKSLEACASQWLTLAFVCRSCSCSHVRSRQGECV